MDLVSALVAAGFAEDGAALGVAVQNADAQQLSANGEYSVKHVLTKGEVLVTVEQNTCPEVLGDGMVATVTHPACAVVTSPKGRVAFNPDDVNLGLSLVADLS